MPSVPKSTEIIAILFSESELQSCLSLIRRFGQHAGYTTVITVLNESPETLIQRVKKELQEHPANQYVQRVESRKLEADEVAEYIASRRRLRLVLVPGLDRLDDFRKAIISQIRKTVLCFEAQQNLDDPPTGICLVGDDPRRYAMWLAERLSAYPEIRQANLEDLQNKDSELSAGEWVIYSVEGDSVERIAKTAKSLLSVASEPVFVIRGAASKLEQFYSRELPSIVGRLVPQMEREHRRKLASDLQEFSKLNFEFVSLICASTFLAAFGLVQNSAAVIIGAMLVAPLMTHILGAGLSLTHGNRPLFANSINTIAFGFFAALATSFCFGLIVHLIAPSILNIQDGSVRITEEMWSRTHPTPIDFLVGFVGGSAAAFARTRGHLADALAGAAIAAALVPPIATAGLNLSLYPLQIESPTGQPEDIPVYGPILLFIVNVLTIMMGASLVLWACGARADHGYSRRARWSTRMFMLLLTLTTVALVWMIQHSTS